MRVEVWLLGSLAALVMAIAVLLVAVLGLRRQTVELREAVQDTAHARDHYQVLLSVAEAVNSSITLNEVLSLALLHSARLVGAAAGAIFLARPGSEAMTRESAYGIAHPTRAASRRLDDPLMRAALAAENPAPEPLGEHGGPGFEGGGRPTHVVVLPIQRAGQLMGAMELYLVSAPFLSADLSDLLKGVAAQAATAIRHAQLYREQEESSYTDELTHLFNRRYLGQRYLQEMQRARRHRKSMAVLMLDIDHFKLVNDTHGHLVGDAVLAELGRILTACVRDSDVCARYGGEEFASILHEARLDGAMRLAGRLRQAVEEAGTFPKGLRLTVSVGVAASDQPSQLGQLLEKADQALYEAKHLGRNQVRAAILEEIEPIATS